MEILSAALMIFIITFSIGYGIYRSILKSLQQPVSKLKKTILATLINGPVLFVAVGQGVFFALVPSPIAFLILISDPDERNASLLLSSLVVSFVVIYLFHSAKDDPAFKTKSDAGE